MSNPFSYTEGSSNRRSNTKNNYMQPANPGNYGQSTVQEVPVNGGQYGEQQFTNGQYSQHQEQSKKYYSGNPASAQQEQQYDASATNSSENFPQLLKDPRAQVAYKLGQSAFGNFFSSNKANGDPSNPNAHNMIDATSHSFMQMSFFLQVSNSYVFHKIKIIVVPFLNKTWYRIQQDPQHQSSGTDSSVSSNFASPRADINCPDLYIPLMGLITYILGWNLEQGFKGSFDPQNLYYKLSSTLAFVVMDLFILKLGLYLIVPNAIQQRSPTTAGGGGNGGYNAGNRNVIATSSGSFIELACFVGYKFVPLTFVLFMRQSPIFNFPILTILVKLYLFVAFGVFLLRSVKFNLLFPLVDHQSAINIDRKTIIRKCNYFLFFYGFIWQVLLMWLMG